MRRIGWSLVAALTLTWQGPPRPGEIAGRVVNAATGEPLAEAILTLTDRNYLSDSQAYSDEDGHFTFPGVSPSSYRLRASKTGYISGAFGQSSAVGSEAEIDVAEGEHRANLIVKLWRPAAIAGVVKDANGQPVAGIPIRLLQSSPVNGRIKLVDTSPRGGNKTTTGAEGEFGFTGVFPGSYAILASAAMVFYPSTPSAAQAQLVTVDAAQTLDGLTMTVPKAALTTITGTVIGAVPGHATTVDLHAASTDDFDFVVATTAAGGDGTFKLDSIPPGSYVLRATEYPVEKPFATVVGGIAHFMPRPAMRRDWPASPRTDGVEWGESWIVVEGHPVRQITVTLQPGLRLSGHVVFDGTSPPPAPDNLAGDSMMLFGLDAGSVATPITGIGRDGAFATVAVPPAKYCLVPMGSFSLLGWTLQSVQYGGRERYGEVVDFSSGDISGAVVTFTDQPSNLTGVVRNDRGDPAPDTPVLLFPTDRRAWVDFGPVPVRLRETRSGRDGTYRFAGLGPGDYYVLALTRPAGPAWQIGSTLESLIPLATRIRISAREDTQQPLRAIAR